MASTCVYIGIYVGISGRTRDEPIRSIWTISHAHMADVDAICCVWGTDSEDECESEEMVADGAGAGGGSLFGLELV